MNGCQLRHDDTQAIAGNGGQDNDCQSQTGAVAPGGFREHQAMITSAGEMGKQPDPRVLAVALRKGMENPEAC